MSQEISECEKSFTDGGRKVCFINSSKELFAEIKNKLDILNKLESIPLSA